MNQENIRQRQLQALENEIVASCAIEGEILNRDSVKASIGKRLSIEKTNNYQKNELTDNYVDILIDANTNYDKNLTLDRIFGWHHAMFPKGYSGLMKIDVAVFRGEKTMQIVSGSSFKEKVYYQAPPRDILESEMDRYLLWFNNTKSSLLKASIAHLWFVIIHPLDDGNGRITRAITDMVLSEIENSKISRLYSMSNTINSDRKAYYNALENTTGYLYKEKPMDITYWCKWFLETLYESLIETKSLMDEIVIKTNFWDKHKDSDLNSRQTKVLNKILDMGVGNFKGGLSKQKYIKIADTTSTTASRDIKELLEKKCIKQINKGQSKNIRYVILV